MPKYRDHLPQLDGGIFLTDGGLETTLIFHDKLELPYFAAFRLLKDGAGSEALRKYYCRCATISCTLARLDLDSFWKVRLGAPILIGVKSSGIRTRHLTTSTGWPSP